MNRRILPILFVAGVIAIPAIYSLNGVCDEPLKSRFEQELDEPREPKPDLGLIVVEPVPATDVYLELVRQKVELLTAEELERETDKLRKEVTELQASRKMREAEQQLERLIDQFQGSAASERARIMLEAGRRHDAVNKNGRLPNPNVPFDGDDRVLPRKRNTVPQPNNDDGFNPRPRS